MRRGQECINYINSTVWATLRKSPIHNIGVFAIRDIPKDTQISDNMDHNIQHLKNILTPDELKMIQPEIRKLILDRVAFNSELPTELPFFSPNCCAILQTWMNHSDTPNTPGTHTLRHIRRGEELTENYNTVQKGALHPLSSKHFHFLKKSRRKKRK